MLKRRRPRRVDQLIAHNGQSHQNPDNEAIHFMTLAPIMPSVVGGLVA